MNLNPGQDETGQGGAPREKTRRSVEGYLVGAEKNLFARPDGAHGYIAAVFQPDAGEHRALVQDPRCYVPAYLGPSGWVGLDLNDGEVDWTEVAELLELSFRETAGTRLVAQLDART